MKIVQIVKYGEPEEVTWESKPAIERQAERIDDGANINLNHEAYYTRIVDAPESEGK